VIEVFNSNNCIETKITIKADEYYNSTLASFVYLDQDNSLVIDIYNAGGPKNAIFYLEAKTLFSKVTTIK
jgi:hypothetical protein